MRVLKDAFFLIFLFNGFLLVQSTSPQITNSFFDIKKQEITVKKKLMDSITYSYANKRILYLSQNCKRTAKLVKDLTQLGFHSLSNKTDIWGHRFIFPFTEEGQINIFEIYIQNFLNQSSGDIAALGYIDCISEKYTSEYLKSGKPTEIDTTSYPFYLIAKGSNINDLKEIYCDTNCQFINNTQENRIINNLFKEIKSNKECPEICKRSLEKYAKEGKFHSFANYFSTITQICPCMVINLQLFITFFSIGL